MIYDHVAWRRGRLDSVGGKGVAVRGLARITDSR